MPIEMTRPPSGNAADFFIDRHICEGRGERVALTDAWRTITYAQLQAETARFAAGLAAAGVRPEERVAILLLDSIEFAVAFWGAIRAGVVPVPVNTLLPPEQAAYILADSRASLAVVSDRLLPGLAPVLGALPNAPGIVAAAHEGCGAPPGTTAYPAFLAGDGTFAPMDASPDATAFWLYSSGSTSAPKGVLHVHSSLRATADTFARQVLGIGPDDVVFSVAKLFFAYGLGNAMTFPFSVGGQAVLLPHRPTPDAVLELCRRHDPTVLCGVPTFFAGMLAHPDAARLGAGRLRVCTSAGEALPAAIGEAWRRVVGVDILDGIGSTEMLHIFLSNQPGALQYGTSGRAVPGYDLRVVDAAGADAPDDEPGELIVRGDSAASGYWNQRAKTRRTFAGEWTYTGDKYIRQPDGYFRYCGRTDDMFKVSGIWVSPFEVETALVSHADVLEAAVVGHPDAEGLVKPRAFVVLKHGRDPSDALAEALKHHVKAVAGVWKYPRWVEFVDDLPKTATGKVQRFKLREGAP